MKYTKTLSILIQASSLSAHPASSSILEFLHGVSLKLEFSQKTKVFIDLLKRCQTILKRVSNSITNKNLCIKTMLLKEKEIMAEACFMQKGKAKFKRLKADLDKITQPWLQAMQVKYFRLCTDAFRLRREIFS